MCRRDYQVPWLVILLHEIMVLAPVILILDSLSVIVHSDIDLKKVDKCIGDPDADVENPILKAEQESQVCLLVTSWLYSSLLDLL